MNPTLGETLKLALTTHTSNSFLVIGLLVALIYYERRLCEKRGYKPYLYGDVRFPPRQEIATSRGDQVARILYLKLGVIPSAGLLKTYFIPGARVHIARTSMSILPQLEPDFAGSNVTISVLSNRISPTQCPSRQVSQSPFLKLEFFS
ncbi:hypothetical protein ACP275_06G111800 [Erythranthe tilingii]